MNIYDCGAMFGKNIGNFLKAMKSKFGLDFSRLSLVGHSIGGGVIGDIGVGIDGQARSIVSLEACTYKDRAKFVQVGTSVTNWFVLVCCYFVLTAVTNCW